MVKKNSRHSEYEQLHLLADERFVYTITESCLNGAITLKTYTKDLLITELKKIAAMGWVSNARPGNAGGIGNTLEDLLGIEENNLPLPNASEWELKCQRLHSTSLVTLFHMEPSPRAFKFVPRVFLPQYGWPHQEAGKKYAEGEMSFRQTISGQENSDRGFKIVVDWSERKVLVSFDANKVESKHDAWLKSVKDRVGLGPLDTQPYWGFDDLQHKAGTKLLNCFYVLADVERRDGKEFFNYLQIMMLQGFSVEKFVTGIEQGYVYVDFDARTGHNHGTKFRLRRDRLPELYEHVTEI